MQDTPRARPSRIRSDLYPSTIDLQTPTNGALYGLGSTVTADYTCSDPDTPILLACVGSRPSGAPLDTSQPGQFTFTVNAFDGGGHLTTKRVTYTVLGPPTIDLRAPTDGALYDLGSSVSVDYSCSDPDSTAVLVCQGDRPTGSPLDTGRPGLHTFTVTASDGRGHIVTATARYTVVGPPTIAIASPVDGASFLIGSTVTAAYSCSSDVPAVPVPACAGTVPNGGALDTATVGAHSFTVTATNAHGLTATQTRSYRVLYAFTGFDTPVDTTGSIAAAKAGDGIPLRFSLAGEKGLGVVTSASWRLASCTDWSTGPPVAASGRLSYTSSTDRYLDVVTTDSAWKGSCRTLVVQLADGTQHPVRVTFTH